MKRVRALTIAISFIFVRAAFADVIFDYEAGSPLAMGRSVDLRLPMDSKKACLVDASAEWIEAGPEGPGGAAKVKVTGEYTDDYRELAAKLHVNGHYKAATAANIANSEGKLELTYDTLGKYADLVFVLLARYDFGSRKLKSPALKPEYQQLLTEKRFGEFIAQCGTHFVTDEERWAYASVVVNINRIDESIKRRLKADYSATATVADVGSMTAGMGVEAQYDNARKFGRATLEFQANGGDSARAAALAAATQSNDILQALQAMQEYMKGIVRDTAVPSRYTLASFALFGLEMPSDDLRVRLLEDAYFAGTRYQAKIGELSQRLTESRRSFGDQADLTRYYRDAVLRLQKQKGAIDALVLKCVRDAVCDRAALKAAAPEIVVTGSVAQNLQLRSTCLYAGEYLDQIDVSLKGETLDPKVIDDLVVYRIEGANKGRRTKLNVTRTSLGSGPDSSFVARLETFNRDLLPPAAPSTDLLALRDQARATRYELDLVMSDGQHQWYDLGTISVQADSCPLKRVQ